MSASPRPAPGPLSVSEPWDLVSKGYADEVASVMLPFARDAIQLAQQISGGCRLDVVHECSDGGKRRFLLRAGQPQVVECAFDERTGRGIELDGEAVAAEVLEATPHGIPGGRGAGEGRRAHAALG